MLGKQHQLVEMEGKSEENICNKDAFECRGSSLSLFDLYLYSSLG